MKFFDAKMTFRDGEVSRVAICMYRETPQKTVDWLNINNHGTLYELAGNGAVHNTENGSATE